jgi:hypothetical protein
MGRSDRRTFIALSAAACAMRFMPRAAVGATSEPASQDLSALTLSGGVKAYSCEDVNQHGAYKSRFGAH